MLLTRMDICPDANTFKLSCTNLCPITVAKAKRNSYEQPAASVDSQIFLCSSHSYRALENKISKILKIVSQVK